MPCVFGFLKLFSLLTHSNNSFKKFGFYQIRIDGSENIVIDDVDFALKQIFNAYNLKGITMEVGE